MGSAEIVGALKVAFVEQVEKLALQLTEAQAKVQLADELAVVIQAEVKAANELGFEEGLAQAGQAGGSDKIYSDAEVNKFIADAIAPFEAKVAELKAEIIALNAEAGKVPALIEAAKAEFKAELLAKFEAQQAEESSSEVKFAELLK